MKTLTIILLSFLLTAPVLSQNQLQKQQLSGYVNPDEIVSLAEHIPFDQAIEILSKVSERNTGKRIVLTTPIVDPIGIEIDKMPFRKALLIIVQYHNMIFEEREEVIVVKHASASDVQLTDDIYAPINSREVKISALFFEANLADMREIGVNWEMLLQKTGLAFGASLNTFTSEIEQAGAQQQEQVQPPEFVVDNETDFTTGDFTGSITGAFKFFETNGLGEVIARPSISVRDKMQGRIQIGEDISIKERDFAGNLIDRFYSTGTIVEVTPYIYNEDGIDYVLLKLQAERSSAEPGLISTTIRKTVANTEVLMLDGESTIIGGLFVHDEVTVRRGIPFLKDLPWWVFGIRYLTGYDATTILKREIIIVITLDILPLLKERIAQKKDDLIKREIEKNVKYLENIKRQTIEGNKLKDDETQNEE